MWGLLGVEAVLALRAARQTQEREFAAHRRVPPREDHTLHPGDCYACGSQEFRTWLGTSVCAYCRSTAQATAAPARHTPVFEEYTAARAADISVRHGLWADIKRRHALARITTD